ncbi:DUF4124 domain-containing protein [Solimonas sp. SE-A11]|uniref:DUF4124 domain-containing protein n=1 Tax=Solimonas sp. SE-A11 TaxID=3054954 RepID=UPI00259CEC00|nr:DUF4124 domain-containing protein [Solimonas sp. SE-A11]MDM4770422.1 DUF4124 domain-containing protein [Solimonas sp. SE-A11]
MKTHALLLPLLLALPGLAAADIYRSVDAQGRVTYSQTPPVGRTAEKVTPRVTPGNPAEAEALQRQVEALDKGQEEAARKETEAAAKQAKQDEACTAARERLALLAQKIPSRLMTRNEKGEMERWTTERHEEQRRQAEALAATSCGGPS